MLFVRMTWRCGLVLGSLRQPNYVEALPGLCYPLHVVCCLFLVACCMLSLACCNQIAAPAHQHELVNVHTKIALTELGALLAQARTL